MDQLMTSWLWPEGKFIFPRRVAPATCSAGEKGKVFFYFYYTAPAPSWIFYCQTWRLML
jgi:hypothetical protein